MKEGPKDGNNRQSQKKQKKQIESDSDDQILNAMKQMKNTSQNANLHLLQDAKPDQQKPQISVQTVVIGQLNTSNSLKKQGNQIQANCRIETISEVGFDQSVNKTISIISSKDAIQIKTMEKKIQDANFKNDFKNGNEVKGKIKEESKEKQPTNGKKQLEETKKQQGVKKEEEVKKEKDAKMHEQKVSGQLHQMHLDKDIASDRYKIYHRKAIIEGRPKDQTMFIQKKVKVMSWNVWNETQKVDPSNKNARYLEIVRVIRQKEPHIVCLQEAEEFRLNYLADFLKFDNVGKTYYISNCSKFSTIIICKMKVDFYEVFFPKEMHIKSQSVCQFKIQCSDKKVRSVIVHSVHLKMRSDNTSATRNFQLEAIENISKKHDIVILAGDFNFDDRHKENNLVRYKHLDLQVHKIKPQEEDIEPPITEQKRENDYYERVEKVEVRKREQKIEEIIEYEFYEDQSSFQGYSDSWNEDSDGNPYDDNSMSGQFGYEERSMVHEEDEEEDEFNEEDDPHFQQQVYESEEEFEKDSEDQDDDDCSDDNSFSQDDYDNQRRSRNRSNNHSQRESYRQRNRQITNRRPRDYNQRYALASSTKKKIKTVTETHKTTTTTKKSSNKNSQQKYQMKKTQKSSNYDPKPPLGQIPPQKPTDTWTFMHKRSQTFNRFDRILISVKGLQKKVLQKKIKVEIFQRLGKYCIGNLYRGQDYRSYMHDGKVRTPSDHLGVFAHFWLNFHY